MGNNKLIKYSTGFYGTKLASSEAVVSPFIEERVARLQYDPTIFNRNPKRTIILNRDISELYTAYMVNAGLFLRKFDNRELVISQALRTIGLDFTQWVLIHLRDEKTKTVVVDFIEDTCNFILTGKRKYPLESWSRMILMDSPPSPYREITPMINAATGLVNHSSVFGERRLTTDIVQKWLMHDVGITDMLQTLYIIFGPDKTETK